jgi:hypothetical protein
MNHMDDYGFYGGKQTGVESFREKLAQTRKALNKKSSAPQTNFFQNIENKKTL